MVQTNQRRTQGQRSVSCASNSPFGFTSLRPNPVLFQKPIAVYKRRRFASPVSEARTNHRSSISATVRSDSGHRYRRVFEKWAREFYIVYRRIHESNRKSLSVCFVPSNLNWTNRSVLFVKLEDEFQKKMDEELKKTARNRRLKFLNCLYGLSELDPEIPITRKVCRRFNNIKS